MRDAIDRGANSLRAGGVMVLASAAAQVLAFAMAGVPVLMIAAVIFAFLGLALLRGAGRAAWPSFLALCIGSVPVAGLLGAPEARPDWIFALILVLNLLGGLALFAHIWRR